MDFAGSHGGELAGAFASGCAAAWGFFQMIVAKPLRRQVDDLRSDIRDLKDECADRDDRAQARISQLETLLLVHGSGPLRNQLQAAISEMRVTGAEE